MAPKKVYPEDLLPKDDESPLICAVCKGACKTYCGMVALKGAPSSQAVAQLTQLRASKEGDQALKRIEARVLLTLAEVGLEDREKEELQMELRAL